MNIHKDEDKLFQILPDYDKELQEIWRSNLRSVKSKVLCESSTIEEIKQQIYLNKTKRRSGLLEVLLAKDGS
ncbi:MAG TPA: hypothetical protein VH796_04445 [Nitrososphaeraceae archaeon]|jgi:hypothetical protein